MAGAAPHPALPLVPPMPSQQQQQQQPPFAPAPPPPQQQQVSPGGVMPQMPPPPGPPMPPFGLPLMQAPGSTGFPTGLPYPGAYTLQQQQQQQQLQQQHHHILMQYHLQQAAAAQSAMLLSSSSSSSAAGMLPPDPAATAAAAAMLRGVATPNPTMMQSGGGVMPATPPLFPPPLPQQQQQQQPPNTMMASTPASGTSSAAPAAMMVMLGGRRSNAGAATTTAVDHHSRGGSAAAAGKASSINGNGNAAGGGDPHFIFDSIPDTRLPAPACPRAGDADTFDRLLKQASDTIDSGSREALGAELRELLAKRYPATLQHLKVLASAAKDVIGLEKQLKRWNTRRIPVPPGVFTPYFLWQRSSSSSSSSETSSPTTSGQPPSTRDCCMKHNGRSKAGTPYDRCRFEDCQYYHGCTFCAAPDHGWYAVGQCAARQRLHDEMQALGLLRDITAPPVLPTDSGMSSSEAEESGSSSDGAERWYTASLVNTHFIKVAAAIRLLFDLPTARAHVYVNGDSAPMVRAHGSIITAAAVLPTDVATASPMNGGISASV